MRGGGGSPNVLTHKLSTAKIKLSHKARLLLWKQPKTVFKLHYKSATVTRTFPRKIFARILNRILFSTTFTLKMKGGESLFQVISIVSIIFRRFQYFQLISIFSVDFNYFKISGDFNSFNNFR